MKHVLPTGHHTSEAAALLEVRGLHVEFLTPEGVVHAVNGVDFDVASGESLAIVGESGSGKTVAAMALVGLVPAPPARVRAQRAVLNGLDLLALDGAELSEVRGARIGFVFQDFFLLPGFSATENVKNGLLYSGVSMGERTDRAKSMLERVGLGHRMEHLPNEMSGGEQQRVAIARALVHNPAFVLADEPTGNLDSRTTASLMELFVELNYEGTTVILITHDTKIAEMSSRQITLNDGRIEADSDGKPGDTRA